MPKSTDGKQELAGVSARARRDYVDVKLDWDGLVRDLEALRDYVDGGASRQHVRAAVLASLLAGSMVHQRLLQMAITLASEE